MKKLIIGLVTLGSISAFANDHVCLKKAKQAFVKKQRAESAITITHFEPISRGEVSRLLESNGFAGKSLKSALSFVDQNRGGYMFEVDSVQFGGYQKEIIFSYSERRGCALKGSSFVVAQD